MANQTLVDNATQIGTALSSNATVPPVFDTGVSVFSTFAWLCLILGAIFLGSWLLKRFGPQSMGIVGGRGRLQLRERIMLGNRQSVCVVRCDDKDFLLGVTEHSINLLHEGDAEPEDEKAGGQDKSKLNFASMLQRKRDEG